MFIFAIYGIQIIGGQLARCNDRAFYKDQVREDSERREWGERSGGFRNCVTEHFGANFSCRRWMSVVLIQWCWFLESGELRTWKEWQFLKIGCSGRIRTISISTTSAVRCWPCSKFYRWKAGSKFVTSSWIEWVWWVLLPLLRRPKSSCCSNTRFSSISSCSSARWSAWPCSSALSSPIIRKIK